MKAPTYLVAVFLLGLFSIMVGCGSSGSSSSESEAALPDTRSNEESTFGETTPEEPIRVSQQQPVDPLNPQKPNPVSPIDTPEADPTGLYTKALDSGVAIECSTSTKIPSQSLVRYEMTEFDKATAMAGDKDRKEILKIALDKLAKHSPKRAARLKSHLEVLELALAIPYDINYVDVRGLYWVPKECQLVHTALFLNRGEGATFAVDAKKFNRLSSLDQAAIFLQLAISAEAHMFKATNYLPARRLARLMMRQGDLSATEVLFAIERLNPNPLVELAYQNGDVVYLKQETIQKIVSGKMNLNQVKHETLFGCGYETVNGYRDVSGCGAGQEGSVMASGAGSSRLMRVKSDSKLLYLVEPLEIGLPSNTVDYMFPQWIKILSDEGIIHYYTYPKGKLAAWFSDEMPMIYNGHEQIPVRCQAQDKVFLTFNENLISTYQAPFQQGTLHACTVTEKLKIRYMGIDFEGFLLFGIFNDSAVFQIEPQKGSIKLGLYTINYSSLSVVFHGVSKGILVTSKDTLQPKTATCKMKIGSLFPENNRMMVEGAYVGDCSIRSPRTNLGLPEWSSYLLKMDLQTGVVRESYPENSLSSVKIRDQDIYVSNLKFTSAGNLIQLTAHTYFDSPVRYFDTKLGKTVEFKYTDGRERIFCYNYEQKRLEELSSNFCKYEGN